MDSSKRYQIRGNNKPLFEHRGITSQWKIDCDAFRLVDWETLARIIHEAGFKFKYVVGVPNGGLLLQKLLSKYKDKNSDKVLIVDDVCTTGLSMENAAAPYVGHYRIEGIVVFNRGKCPSWVTPIFDLNERFT